MIICSFIYHEEAIKNGFKKIAECVLGIFLSFKKKRIID